MRLTPDQQSAICAAVAESFGDGTAVWLFGSRADDSKRGGDIDLLIRPDAEPADALFAKKIRLLTRLERLLGERKIDVLIETPNDPRPIVQIAHQTGVRLS